MWKFTGFDEGSAPSIYQEGFGDTFTPVSSLESGFTGVPLLAFFIVLFLHCSRVSLPVPGNERRKTVIFYETHGSKIKHLFLARAKFSMMPLGVERSRTTLAVNGRGDMVHGWWFRRRLTSRLSFAVGRIAPCATSFRSTLSSQSATKGRARSGRFARRRLSRSAT